MANQTPRSGPGGRGAAVADVVAAARARGRGFRVGVSGLARFGFLKAFIIFLVDFFIFLAVLRCDFDAKLI